MIPRESRREVVIPAQMRSKGGWSDVTIRNISPHGMMLLAPFPPKPGTVIEVRKASVALVGRVVWVQGKTLGVQLIERLNFTALFRAANEASATGPSPVPETTAGALRFTRGRGGILAWLLAGSTLLLASGCAAVALWQI